MAIIAKWYIDATALAVERSVDPLRNSVYAVYRDANGRNLRTAVADDENSQEQQGLIRRASLTVNTTDATQAESHRDAFLADSSHYALRATVGFEALYDLSGGRYPLSVLRAHDTLVIRNWPQGSADFDDVGRFMCAYVEYTAAPEMVRVEPDTPVPTLVTLIARQGAGL